jgi:hypothetical protein
MKNWQLIILTIIIGSLLTYVGGLIWWNVNANIGHGIMFGSLFGMTFECWIIGKKWYREKQAKK